MCEEVADQKLQFQSAAMGLVQTIAEDFVVAMLSECAIYAAHAKRRTVLVICGTSSGRGYEMCSTCLQEAEAVSTALCGSLQQQHTRIL